MSFTQSARFAFCFTVLFLANASAQTEVVLHRFLSSVDGANSYAGLTADAKGNLYGTTYSGGESTNCFSRCGTVFELSPPTAPNTEWTETILHSFMGDAVDGCGPLGGVVFDSVGNLYGTTSGCESGPTGGTVFQLTPPTDPSGAWTETVLFTFPSLLSPQGGLPRGNLVIDSKGDLFGVTEYGGINGTGGVVFEVSSAAGIWTESVLYNFGPAPNGSFPMGGLIADEAGNLYGTTYYGGTGDCNEGGVLGCGTVFRLQPPQQPGGAWVETAIYSFQQQVSGDGYYPVAGVVMDKNGNLYGTTPVGVQCEGTVFQLTPRLSVRGDWTKTVLYAFGRAPGGAGPLAGVVLDSVGRVYGTTAEGGAYCSDGGCGTVFQLSPPTLPGGAWTETGLYSFRATNGTMPSSSLAIAGGRILGTTVYGGGPPPHGIGNGVVFSLKP